MLSVDGLLAGLARFWAWDTVTWICIVQRTAATHITVHLRPRPVLGIRVGCRMGRQTEQAQGAAAVGR